MNGNGQVIINSSFVLEYSNKEQGETDKHTNGVDSIHNGEFLNRVIILEHL
jgi:hypothetical protein